jgi:alpha-L-rhamnosidase
MKTFKTLSVINLLRYVVILMFLAAQSCNNQPFDEFDSKDMTGEVTMSISEYNEPTILNRGAKNRIKTLEPVKYGNTYRLELNDELFEGVRFGWIHVNTFEKEWYIDNVRLVCQIKPVNCKGSFSCSDSLLTKIWYTGAYGVELNLIKIKQS